MNYQVFETIKMKVERNDDHIIKTFKPVHGFQKRYQAEKAALKLLNDIEGIPKILEVCDEVPSIKMTLLPGKEVNELSMEQAREVKRIISAGIESGVARHSLPLRDILGNGSGKVGIVDFERVTIRDKSDPVTWHVARKVAFFHLARLLYEHQPSLLSKKDKMAVTTGFKVRSVFKKYMIIRDAVRNRYRMVANTHRNSL